MGVRVLSTVGVAALAIGGAVALAPVASADSWTMPNLIGMNLQGAQDAIQALTDDKVWLQRFDRSDRQGSDADQRPRVGGVQFHSPARRDAHRDHHRRLRRGSQRRRSVSVVMARRRSRSGSDGTGGAVFGALLIVGSSSGTSGDSSR